MNVTALTYFLAYDPFTWTALNSPSSTTTAVFCLLIPIGIKITLYLYYFELEKYPYLIMDSLYSLFCGLIIGLGHDGFWEFLLLIPLIARMAIQYFLTPSMDSAERLLYSFECLAAVMLLLAGVVRIEGAFPFTGLVVLYSFLFIVRHSRKADFNLDTLFHKNPTVVEESQDLDRVTDDQFLQND
jgi:hypothetical protein